MSPSLRREGSVAAPQKPFSLEKPQMAICLTALLLFAVRAPGSCLTAPSPCHLPSAGDGISAGGLAHLGESSSVFLGLSLYTGGIHAIQLLCFS